MAYYMGTTILAVILGIILVTTIHPGTHTADKDVRYTLQPVPSC